MSVDDTKIEKLKRRLFSNSGKEVPPVPRMRLQKHQVLVKEAWDTDPSDENPVMHPLDVAAREGQVQYGSGVSVGSNNPVKISGVDVRNIRADGDQDTRGSFVKKVLGFSVLVFLAAAAFAAYMFITGSNSVSNNNIDISLVGPVTSPAGEDLSLDVNITNRNSTDLVLADLVITYPDGTRRSDDKATSMPVERIDIGTVPKGQTVRQTIKSVLFGEENSLKNIKISIEYRIDGSSNVFVKEKDYPIFIGSSPIAVTVDSQGEAVPEEEHDFVIHIKSNSTSIIKGLVFKAEYPFGFQFLSSVPATSGDQSTWVLGDVQPGEQRDITLKGRILGGEQQERVFKFYTGTEDPVNKANIGTVFVTNNTSVVLKKPFISADLALDGTKNAVYIAHAGNNIDGEITWQNNLNVSLNDVVIEARLTGDMLDKSSVKGDQGFYRSSDNTIIWDKSDVGSLATVKSGAIGRFRFTFAALDPSIDTNSRFRKQSLKVDLAVRAKRLNEDRVPEEINSNVSRTVQISSDITATTRLVRTVGPFVNTGPIPTVPEQPSTYTVLVSLKNSYNNIKDLVYTATLPQYVSWVGLTYPTNAGVSYNADSRQITWQIGDLQPGTGFNSSAKEFAYQVSFLPSLGQRDSTPDIVVNQKVVGKDTFTGGIIEVSTPSLDIKTESDPKYKYGDDKVGGAN